MIGVSDLLIGNATLEVILLLDKLLEGILLLPLEGSKRLGTEAGSPQGLHYR